MLLLGDHKMYDLSESVSRPRRGQVHLSSPQSIVDSAGLFFVEGHELCCKSESKWGRVHRQELNGEKTSDIQGYTCDLLLFPMNGLLERFR